MILDDSELARAIFFIENKASVAREMHYTEFEAILDGFIPAMDWAGRQVRAVFLEIDSSRLIRSALFFNVSYDANGKIESDWNLPIDLLINQAGKGPDLGAGAIKLVCYSRCPVSYLKAQLWDPEMGPSNNVFNALKRSVERNNLGLEFRTPRGTGTPSLSTQSVKQSASDLAIEREYITELRNHMAQLLREQRLRADTLQADRTAELKQITVDYNHQIESYRELMREKEKTIEELRDKNTQLKETIEGQAQKIEGLREYFEHKIDSLSHEEVDHLEALQENFNLELEAKLEAATLELKELLQLREVELQYRNEQEKNLRQEVTRLREEIKDLMGRTGDELLDKMRSNGINFVTYQPGAGHITIPANKLSLFLESPVAYTAEYCKVSEQQYLAWLAHYQTPVCQEVGGSGDYCHQDIPRIPTPNEFRMGDSDRCRHHKPGEGKPKLRLA